MVQISKRGQAAGAAVLLIVIVGMLIGFIVMVSPQERADILGENISKSSGGKITSAAIEKNMLTVYPGRIDYLAQSEIEHPLPVINIFTRTSAEVLDERNVIYTKKGVFSEATGEFKFDIEDLANTHNVLLNFRVLTVEGRLIISLNGVDVFDAELSEGNIQPINLPENLLQDSNTLMFTVSSPGIAFWKTNEASLEKVKVIGDVTDVEAQYSKNIFLVSETEWDNLEKIVLKFQ